MKMTTKTKADEQSLQNSFQMVWYITLWAFVQLPFGILLFGPLG